ncbi:MAG TPA: DUF2480 family protein [Parafilimonas sp.]|nr:DUF2480 family protein [Parafilimonas sp.]
MQIGDEIVNRVAESGLVTIDLEDFYPKEELKIFDLKEYLFRGLIIKEKDFREALKNVDWNRYANANVALTCTADAIIPVWAYMLATSYLQPFAKNIVLGDEKKVVETLLLKNMSQLDPKEFADKRVVIKGCGEIQIPESAYVQITATLLSNAKTIMYGEPCSTVPIYKRKN